MDSALIEVLQTNEYPHQQYLTSTLIFFHWRRAKTDFILDPILLRIANLKILPYSQVLRFCSPHGDMPNLSLCIFLKLFT